MEDGLAICARDLVLAVFRLAVADYLGVCYGHDEPAPFKRRNGGCHLEGADFLRSPWAAHLADLAGVPIKAVWQEAERQRAWGEELGRAA